MKMDRAKFLMVLFDNIYLSCYNIIMGAVHSGKAVQSFLGNEVVEMKIMELLTLLMVVIEIIKLNNKKK